MYFFFYYTLNMFSILANYYKCYRYKCFYFYFISFIICQYLLYLELNHFIVKAY